MEDIEKKIEEAANIYSKKYPTLAGIDLAFMIGVKSPEAKEYWQQGMYTENDIMNALHQVEIKHNRNYTQMWLNLKDELQNKKK